MEKMGSALQRQLENFCNLTKTAAPQKAEVIHLPVWKEQQRGTPNAALRSALFAAIQGKNRKAMQREVLASQNGVTIRFTGIQLDQSDLDVWEQALEFAKHEPLGAKCDFKAKAFLKALGRNTGKSDRESLKNAAARLAGCCVEITHGRYTYGGSLLEFYRDEVTDRYVLVFNPKLKDLYNAGYTHIDWQQRRLLQRKPLALWLHGFLASHAEPYPLKVESLMKWSGSQTQEKRYFKKNLKAALEELLAVGAVVSYRFAGDLLYVERVPSPSQQRHLARKTKAHR